MNGYYAVGILCQFFINLLEVERGRLGGGGKNSSADQSFIELFIGNVYFIFEHVVSKSDVQWYNGDVKFF
jgi:hypothetical protein